MRLTPLVEPLSIDEAFLDLSGTERLHGLPAAKVLARFALEVEKKLAITVSIGLSCNKFLAKIASDLDKPRGFAVLGAGEAQKFLAPKPVGFIFGVGKVSAARLARDGFHCIADLQRASEIEMARRYGDEGRRLARLARGIDERKVSADRETKSVSSETTFDRDISDYRDAGTHPVGADRGSLGTFERKGLRRRHRDVEAQDRRLQNSHSRPFVRFLDTAGGAKSLPLRARCSNAKVTARNTACSASA